jgi:hypothetical protein
MLFKSSDATRRPRGQADAGRTITQSLEMCQIIKSRFEDMTVTIRTFAALRQLIGQGSSVGPEKAVDRSISKNQSIRIR